MLIFYECNGNLEKNTFNPTHIRMVGQKEFDNGKCL